MGTETPKNIELTYDSIKSINYPVKKKLSSCTHANLAKFYYAPLRRIVFVFFFPV